MYDDSTGMMAKGESLLFFYLLHYNTISWRARKILFIELAESRREIKRKNVEKKDEKFKDCFM